MGTVSVTPTLHKLSKKATYTLLGHDDGGAVTCRDGFYWIEWQATDVCP